MQPKGLCPRWLIYKLSYPGGFRQRKLVKPRWDSGRVIPLGPVRADKNRLDFDNAEFRFWTVERDSDDSPLATICRACGAITGNSGMGRSRIVRGSHLELHKCAINLVAAYKLLHRDNKCIVCDTKTTKLKWGVPLCLSASCLNIFMYEEPQSDALAGALTLVKVHGR